MKIKVENFGPVKKAQIQIRPLTILVGQNNIGKSYLTQLIQALFDSLLGIFAFPGRGIYLRARGLGRYTYARHMHGRIYVFRVPVSDKELRELRKMLKDDEMSGRKILETMLEKVKIFLATLIKRELRRNLEQIFGMRVGRLVGLGASQSTIELEFNQYSTLKIIMTSKHRLHVEILVDARQRRRFERRFLSRIDEARQLKRLTSERIFDLYHSCLMAFFSFALEDSIYIPAGRAGLLESYDTVAAALFNLSSVAAVYGLSMPPLPGVASKFYSRLLALRGEEGPLCDIADKMKLVFGGSINLIQSKGGPSRIYYTFKRGRKSRRVEVIHAASMIKELAPLYLIAREDVTPDSILIVEEPESHLHPSAQCQLVEIFSELVLKKTRIIITTHSDLILRKLGNLIGYFKYKDLDEHGVSLDPSMVVIYLLADRGDGSISKKIPIPPDGIFEELPEFDEVIKNLYEEQLMFQQKAQLGE